MVVTTHPLHAVCVLLVCGPSPYTGYQVDFLCLLEQGTAELIIIHNLAFICLVLPSGLNTIGLLLFSWLYHVTSLLNTCGL
jgi:hypothetical protein